MAAYNLQTVIATTATIILFVIILLAISKAAKHKPHLLSYESSISDKPHNE